MAKVAKRRGRYIIDFYDHTGKRRWKTLPKGTTKKQANEELRNIEDQVRRSVYLPDRRIPKFSQVAKDYLEFASINVRASTLKAYEGHVNNHFDSIKDLMINRITIATVEKFISEKQKAGMNIATLRKIIGTFNRVMKYAVRHGYIGHNPVVDAERPKDRRPRNKKSKMHFLKPNQIVPFLDAETDPKYKMLFRLAIFSGARQGELFGLKWSDVDWINNQIYIQRSFNNGQWYPPKTEESYRKIDIGPETMAMLRKWMLACMPNDMDLVFPNLSGDPLNHAYMYRHHFWPALKAANLPKIRFHDLRHTFASLLYDQGENIRYIQAQMGHSDPSTTLSVYAHLMRPNSQEAARTLENTVFEQIGSKMVAKTKKGIMDNSITP